MCVVFVPFWCSVEFVPRSAHIVIAIRHLQEESHFFFVAFEFSSRLFFRAPILPPFLTIQTNLFYEYFLMSFAPTIFSLAYDSKKKPNARELESSDIDTN